MGMPKSTGSSPWARGTLHIRPGHNRFRRFIPVVTGNTKLFVKVIEHGAVHPRGHGEHINNILTVHPLAGSSPWARGTLTLTAVGKTGSRFIPVGTGNTPIFAMRSQYSSVHPRGHGEHQYLRYVLNIHAGSSPWARGTRYHHAGYYAQHRFIPVGTGNTNTHSLQQFAGAVHPRGHGEHKTFVYVCHWFPGSSPWARGTLPPLIKRLVPSRFIPVGTGNTHQFIR